MNHHTTTPARGDKPSTPDFRAAAIPIAPDLIALRRELHAHPELGLQLPATQQRVLSALEGLPLEVTRGSATTSVVAVLRGGRAPGNTNRPSVLLRGDMDGLPLVEETGLPFASLNGAMHACGHDLHTAGLVGAARLLCGVREQLPGDVVFMFQPAEETLEGAKIMLDEGLLEAAGGRPIAGYAIHVAQGPAGVFGLSAGPSAAGSSTLSIELAGPGGHASRPHETVDLVPILAEIILSLQSFVTRQVDAQDAAVVTVTMLDAGSAANIVSTRAFAGGTVRALRPETMESLKERLPRYITALAAAHGADAQVTISPGCPPMANDHALTDQTEATLRRMFGAGRVARFPDTIASMGGEDFAFVSREIPVSYFRMFVTPPNTKRPSPNHSSTSVFDDSFLGDQAAALAALAWDRLAAEV